MITQNQTIHRRLRFALQPAFCKESTRQESARPKTERPPKPASRSLRPERPVQLAAAHSRDTQLETPENGAEELFGYWKSDIKHMAEAFAGANQLELFETANSVIA
jgi:hypothetical protein